MTSNEKNIYRLYNMYINKKWLMQKNTSSMLQAKLLIF